MTKCLRMMGILTKNTVYMPASKKSTSASNNGNPRRARKPSDNGKNYKTHPTTLAS